jgi:hypothetical protein
LSELADHRKVHGHCNVPRKYSENAKLGSWVASQRYQYSLHLKGETSSLSLPRIKALDSLGFEWGSHGSTCSWEDRLSELANYRKIHGHCNVPQKYSENSKLGRWVTAQRQTYSLHLKGKRSPISLPRIKALENLGFEWCSRGANCPWEDRISELANYRKVHGHCNVPTKYSGNAKLGTWVASQRKQYSLHLNGKTSSITLPRIQALENLGFEWGSSQGATCTWEDRLSELADYRKVHGHCNVPKRYIENSKLVCWVARQRQKYSLHLKGETSPLTLPRIKALESLGFEWGSRGATCPWEVRLSELADYRKIHGHCNVPQKYSENTKLGSWVANQRKQYRLHLNGKISSTTLPRIQALESLGFEWKTSIGRRSTATRTSAASTVS